MRYHHPPRHCFVVGYWFRDAAQLYVRFTEGEIYRFDDVGPSFWLTLKSQPLSGVDFDANWRPPNRSTRGYARVHSIPGGWDDWILR
jgi:hypothetical protein